MLDYIILTFVIVEQTREERLRRGASVCEVLCFDLGSSRGIYRSLRIISEWDQGWFESHRYNSPPRRGPACEATEYFGAS